MDASSDSAGVGSGMSLQLSSAAKDASASAAPPPPHLECGGGGGVRRAGRCPSAGRPCTGESPSSTHRLSPARCPLLHSLMKGRGAEGRGERSGGEGVKEGGAKGRGQSGGAKGRGERREEWRGGTEGMVGTRGELQDDRSLIYE